MKIILSVIVFVVLVSVEAKSDIIIGRPVERSSVYRGQIAPRYTVRIQYHRTTYRPYYRPHHRPLYYRPTYSVYYRPIPVYYDPSCFAFGYNGWGWWGNINIYW